MTLGALPAYEVEKALTRGRTLEAIKIYREATGCDLIEAKAAVAKIEAELRIAKPWYFKDRDKEGVVASSDGSATIRKRIQISPRALGVFFLVDALIFGALIFLFVFEGDELAKQYFDRGNKGASPSYSGSSTGQPKALALPQVRGNDSYSAPLAEGETFLALYEAKIASDDYVDRKSGSSRDYDDSELERKIKTARSRRAAQREAPSGMSVTTIPLTPGQPTINGVMADDEWFNAVALRDGDTTLYLQSDREWLFIAADVPGEVTADGYDQLRVNFHPGLFKKLVNERIHIGRGPAVTSIRQTRFRWQGDPPTSDDERWKKYNISDWGLYRYAVGTSSMVSDHRQYEAAVHLGEAGIHPDVPFTLYAEIETDPLKNADGKFVERQYLGQMGSEDNPIWLKF